MKTKYDTDINNKSVLDNLYRIGNQIFKLLPMKEEQQNWLKPLETLIIEILGMSSLFPDQKDLLSLVCKLEGLKECGENVEFRLYRRTIFEACGLVDKIKQQCQTV